MRLTGTATLSGHTYAVFCVAFSPDGVKIVSGSLDKTFKIWDVRTNNIMTFKGHSAAVTGVAFSPDGKQVASASQDNTVILWDVQTGRLLKTLNAHTQKP